METVRVVIAIVAQHKWKVFQMDVKSAFLTGILKEEVYVEQPPGYEVVGEENKLYRLKRALYGLKQAPRPWYNRIDSYLMRMALAKAMVSLLSTSRYQRVSARSWVSLLAKKWKCFSYF